MSPPLRIANLTPNGEIRTADLLTSIAKRLRLFATTEYSGRGPERVLQPRSHTCRVTALREYAEELEILAETLEPTP